MLGVCGWLSAGSVPRASPRHHPSCRTFARSCVCVHLGACRPSVGPRMGRFLRGPPPRPCASPWHHSLCCIFARPVCACACMRACAGHLPGPARVALCGLPRPGLVHRHGTIIRIASLLALACAHVCGCACACPCRPSVRPRTDAFLRGPAPRPRASPQHHRSCCIFAHSCMCTCARVRVCVCVCVCVRVCVCNYISQSRAPHLSNTPAHFSAIPVQSHLKDIVSRARFYPRSLSPSIAG